MCASMGTVTGFMLVFAAPKNQAMPSHFSIQFLLFNLHFGSCGAYNPYFHEKGKNLQHLFKENCQVQPFIKFSVGGDFYPFCCHYKIGFFYYFFLFSFIFSCAIFLESSIQGFSFVVMVTCLLLYDSTDLIEPFSNSNYCSGPFSSLFLSSHCSHSDSI